MPFTVVRLRTRHYSAPLSRPFVTARRRVEHLTGVLVELELDDGTVGHGSAAETLAVTGESQQSIVAALHGPIEEALTSATDARGTREHAAAIAASCAGNFGAKAAAEVALHDAWARRLGLPLADTLGGNARSVLHTDMTISLDSQEAMAHAADEAARDGFTTLKVKLGSDWRADLDRLRAVRDVVPNAWFRLDANQGWEPKSAIHIIRAIEDAGIPLELVEQPVDKNDLDGLAAVTAAVDVPIMAD